MRSMRLSQLALLVGVSMGLVALYGSAAPVFGSGDSIVGGFYVYYYGSGYVGCTESSCNDCQYTTLASCGDAANYDCGGGTITIAVAAHYSAPSTRGGSYAGCTPGAFACWDLRHATCSDG